MGRLCERPGCSDVAAMAYGFDVDRLLVWLAPRDPDGDPLRAGVAVPAPRRRDGRAAGLDARRPARADAAAVPPGAADDQAPRGAGRRGPPRPRRRRPPRAAPPEQLALAETAAGAGGGRAERTVAEVTGGRSPTTTPTPPWRSRGCPTSTTTTTSAACSRPTARCWPGRSAAPTARADRVHTSVDVFIDGATADDCSSTSRARPLPAVDAARPPGRAARARRRPAGVAGRAARPGRAVRPLEAAADGAHGVRARTAGALRAGSRTTTATTPSGSSAPTVAPADGGAHVTMDLAYTGELWSSGVLGSGCSTTRSAGARPRVREPRHASTPTR